MKDSFKKLLPSGLWEAAAAAAGLLLALYPAAAWAVLIKAASALGIFFILYRLLDLLRAGCRRGYGEPLALTAGFVLSLACFLRPGLFPAFAALALGLLLVLYALLRIPMIGERWALGLRYRLASLAWAVAPLIAGVLLLCHPLAAAALLLRLAGLLLLLWGLACLADKWE